MTQDVEIKPQENAQTTSEKPAAAENRSVARPFDRLRQEIDQIFDNFGERQRRMFDWPSLESIRLPSVDLEDRDKEFRLTAELPGFDAKEVTLEMRDGSLLIRARHEESKEERKEQMLIRERSSGSLERLVPVPQAIDIGTAHAELKDGVLTVNLPKQIAAAPSPQRISVQG